MRPKLHIPQQSANELEKHASYQRKFVDQAVQLLKPGGYLTYSTCTINASENEGMIRYILQEYPCMELLPVIPSLNVGQPGLEGYGLTEEERKYVRRFDPSDEVADTMGFFVALFRKQNNN